MNKLQTTFRSLRYKNFRLFFPGLITSQVGIWIQNVTISWVVYSLTKSPFMMGGILFINTLPLFLVTPFAGMIIDKFDRRKLLLVIQILFALQAFLMAISAMTNHLMLWNIITLGLFLNIVAAVDAPLRQSVYILLVDDKADLSNALSLNAACFNVARLIGPAAAGVLISAVGTAWCFTINFLCILPCVFLVMMMDFKDKKSDSVKNKSIVDGVKEGLEYAFHSEQILSLLAFAGVFSFIALTYPLLIPIYTKEVLFSDADTLGWIMSCTGIGALCSSIYLATRTSLKGLQYIVCTGAAVLSIGFILMGFIHSTLSSCIIMFFAGLGFTSAITSDCTLLQSILDDDKRGRVMSLYSICFMGATSISNLIAGSIAQFFGIANTFIIFGAILLCSAVIFLLKFLHLEFKAKI